MAGARANADRPQLTRDHATRTFRIGRTMSPALSPEAFVTGLYQSCLGRLPEPGAVDFWIDLMQQRGDPTVVLAGLMGSEEFRARASTASPSDDKLAALAGDAFRRLDRRPRVVDVGAQLMGPGSHPYDPLRAFGQLDVVGFDPLEHRLNERIAAEAGDGLLLLPYAIGDGGTHTLHINNADATSSLFPLNAAHNARFPQLAAFHTVRTEQVATRRLDDVLAAGPVDFLKLDIQGAELMVLRSATKTLARTAVIHCEVEFSPIYEGQPLYPDVQVFLNAEGFELIDLVWSGKDYYATPSGESASDRLLWADAVFFKQTDDRDVMIAQALIAAAVYGKPTLAEHLLSKAAAA
ncbi:FkbM family methyltransferase [Methylobacterium sp. WL69]|uniref:FkbM family methyltransferase n=1 Tax=Methylobacterium sp. WL69 TaxID=2603893 RepID=UPI001650ABCD|nr:FkbM family methyltransferase [Methylobacterium sp. WL69]